MGKIENKGWELEIGWRDQIGEVKYNLLFNLSDAKNKIVDLGTSEPRLTNNIRREGDPIDAYYGYLTDGLAQIDDFGGVDSNGKYINNRSQWIYRKFHRGRGVEAEVRRVGGYPFE